MADLLRFGVSMEKSLLDEFDGIIARKGYANRSDAIRALVRDLILGFRQEENPALDVVGTISLVYDHAEADLQKRLTDLQHRSHDAVISSLHVHIDAHDCLEVLVVRGKLSAVKAMADSLIGTRGVHHGKLMIDAAGSDAPRSLRRGRGPRAQGH